MEQYKVILLYEQCLNLMYRGSSTAARGREWALGNIDGVDQYSSLDVSKKSTVDPG